MKTRLWPLLAVILLGLAAAGGAAAHAELLAAEPAPGANLDEAPAVIRLTFSEPLGAQSGLTLFRGGFEEVAGVTAAVDPAEPAVLQATLPELEPGDYMVQWRAAGPDGHAVSGSYQFRLRESNASSLPAAVLLLAAVGLLVIGSAIARGNRRPG
ncbi:MAG: copper resistance CopC family protein [Candidatus Promineifilaceae bacterium]